MVEFATPRMTRENMVVINEENAFFKILWNYDLSIGVNLAN